MLLAVIKTGGKQYKVKEGDVLKIEKLDQEAGKKIIFDQVLLVSDEEGNKIAIGAPIAINATVEGKILTQERAKKVIGIKYKPKSPYRKKIGHRQLITKVEITKIKLGNKIENENKKEINKEKIVEK